MRPNAQRLVILVEIPPVIVAQMNEERISPNPRALDIAKRAAEQQSLFSAQSYFPYHSETIAKVGDSTKLGEPALVAEDGSKAWIVRRPVTHEKRSS
ncbi:MAG TPA: hypothetical protein VFO40_02640 [Chthoniobacterales bacterium]|nr:hypothetical protein [Chthoniobacterales bacterium]